MPIKVTFFFANENYTWSETHYDLTNLLLGSPSLTTACVQYAAKRVPLLGVGSSLFAIRVANVPGNRFVDEIDDSLFVQDGTWPSDPTGQLYSSDRPYSSLLLRMQSGTSTKNWYLAGIPDSLIGTRPNARLGFSYGFTPDFKNRLTALMTFLTSGGWGFRSTLGLTLVQSQGLVTQTGFAGQIGVSTAAALPGVAVGSLVKLTGWRRKNPRTGGLSGVFTVSGIISPASPATTPFVYFLLNTPTVDPTNFSTVGKIGLVAYTYPAYTGYDAVKAVSHKRGGSAFLPRGRSRIRR